VPEPKAKEPEVEAHTRAANFKGGNLIPSREYLIKK